MQRAHDNITALRFELAHPPKKQAITPEYAEIEAVEPKVLDFNIHDHHERSEFACRS